MNETAAPRTRWKTLAGFAVVAIAVSAWIYHNQVADAQRRALQSARRPPPAVPEFDMSQTTIPVFEIHRGGPPKDGIPALTDARFVSADEAPFMAPEDRVIGIAWDGQAKAYPHKILDYHEAVNDRLGDRAILVTYCPLCDCSAVFDRRFGAQQYEFGISGRLYNSNVLLYDRAVDGPESLWSQMAAAAVTGVQSGQPLRRLPLEVTTWGDWHTRHPQTLVLSTETGHQRTYNRGVYQAYFDSPKLMFPVAHLDKRLPLKTPVLGVMSDKVQRAYPLANFTEKQAGRFEDEIDGRRLTLVYEPRHHSLRVEQADPELEWMYAFWFAWSAFYPETQIYPSP